MNEKARSFGAHLSLHAIRLQAVRACMYPDASNVRPERHPSNSLPFPSMQSCAALHSQLILVLFHQVRRVEHVIFAEGSELDGSTYVTRLVDECCRSGSKPGWREE